MLGNKISIIFSILFLLFGLVLLTKSIHRQATVFMGGRLFSVETVDTLAKQEKGLSGHAPLTDWQGMLFIFSKPDDYGFWMKDMLYPLDIIWIGSDWRITHIEHSLATSSYPTIYSPGTPSQYVLEINSGLSDQLGIKVGDTVQFSQK